MFEESCQETKEQGGADWLQTPGPAPAPGEAPSFTDEAVSILTSTRLLAQSLLGPHHGMEGLEPAGSITSTTAEEEASVHRRRREFTPAALKDPGYWDRRRKNNEAARRSREKRRLGDAALEGHVDALLRENARLRAELLALRFRFGLVREPSGSVPANPVPATPAPDPSPTAPLFGFGHPEGEYHHPHNHHHHHHHPLHHHPLPVQGCPCGGRRGDGGSLSEDSWFPAPGRSGAGSPVYFGEHGRPRPESHPCPVEEQTPGGTGLRGDPAEGLKSLPHKLRFKSLVGRDGGSAPGGSRRQSPTGAPGARGARLGHWPSGGPAEEGPQAGEEPQSQAENAVLHSELSSLSREVAELKRLFSQQLNHGNI
ncbi:nuclear factor, interleukin 3 regulated, member 6 [Conger conger]|uniref:nuclear factor, interleukin 3 regulated, member 6 n=1 Tax=Conger conger TaxID=82655 RepID=UPI002A5AF251|nr:nuclear factor, interleukin 3 regulated, member 6 [Conger conger]